MKTVLISTFGREPEIVIGDVAEPGPPGEHEVKVRVRAAGLNRADLMQAAGLYPPPNGYEADRPGLEFAGEIAEIGSAVQGFEVGDRVFAITAGEAQAELVVSDESLLTKIPDNLSFAEAAAVPEAFITAHDAVVTQGGLKNGDFLLVHAVGSGVGLAALQIARSMGAFVIGTSRTAEKLEKCRDLGLDGVSGHGLLTTEPVFSERVSEITRGRGCDVILDLVGGAYFEENLKSLASKGRLMVVGLTAGRKAEIDLGLLLTKRAKVIGTALRSRSLDEKAEATRLFARDVIPRLADGSIKPVVDRVFPMSDAAAAYKYLASNESFGKVVLEF